jgi:mono/diheme cytochrome c family protein
MRRSRPPQKGPLFMTSAHRSIALSAVSAALFAVACGGSPKNDAASLAKYQGAIASTDVAAGQAAWDKACSACHTAETGGESVFGIGWSAAKVRMQVREGDSEMPPVTEKRLSAAELESLLAFLVTKGTVAADAAAATAAATEATP